MAVRDMSLEELLSRRQFVNPLEMSEYEAEFGRQRLADLMAARQQILGAGTVPMGATGMVGSAFRQAGALEGRRAAAAGELASRAQSGRDLELRKAAFKRQLEEAQAKRATRGARRELEGKVLGLVGDVASQGIQDIEAIVPEVRKDIARREAEASERAMRLRNARKSYMERKALQAGMSEEALAQQEERLLISGLQLPGARAAGPYGGGIQVGEGDEARTVLGGAPRGGAGLRGSFWDPSKRNYESLLGAVPQFELVAPQAEQVPFEVDAQPTPDPSRFNPLKRTFPDYYQSMFESANFPAEVP